MVRMPRRDLKVAAALVGVAAAVITAVSCGGGARPEPPPVAEGTPIDLSPAPAPTALPAPRHLDNLGSLPIRGGRRILTDDRGMTLYVNDQAPRRATSSCDGGCLALWKPVLLRPDQRPSGIVPGTTKRFGALPGPARRNRQLAVGGRRAYTFGEDHKPGDVRGYRFTNTSRGQPLTWSVIFVPGGTNATVTLR